MIYDYDATTTDDVLFDSYVLLNYLHAPPRRAPVNRKCRRATAPRVSEARTLERFGLPELKCSQVVNAGPEKGPGNLCTLIICLTGSTRPSLVSSNQESMRSSREEAYERGSEH